MELNKNSVQKRKRVNCIPRLPKYPTRPDIHPTPCKEKGNNKEIKKEDKRTNEHEERNKSP